MSELYGPPPSLPPQPQPASAASMASFNRLFRIAIAGLCTALLGGVALLMLIEAADFLGAKKWFEDHEGPTSSTRAAGDNPDEASLFGFGVGIGLMALYAACWLVGWRLRIVFSGLLALLAGGVATLWFAVAGSPSLAGDLADSSTLACTLELPERCAEGWTQTAEAGRYPAIAILVTALITFAVHLALSRSAAVRRWMDESRF